MGRHEQFCRGLMLEVGIGEMFLCGFRGRIERPSECFIDRPVCPVQAIAPAVPEEKHRSPI